MKRALAGVLALAAVSIAAFEGRKFVPYYDIANVLTVCDGHTGPGIIPGKVYTVEECDALLASDIYRHDADISKCIKVPLKDHEHASFVHFAFNVGSANFCKSTMVRLANQRDMRGACQQLLRWVYVGGRDCRKAENRCGGIVRRRQYEHQLCLGNVPL